MSVSEPDGRRAVRVPAGVDDALRALLVLATSPGPMTARQIGEREGIPHRFLSTVLLALRAAGLVTARVGREGGYSLAQDPEAITVAAVFAAVDPRPPAPGRGSETTEPLWASLERSVQDRLAGITLADLAVGAPDPPPGTDG